MTELDIIHTEARIKKVKAIIADTRKNSTDATRANDEEAIQELAIPELRKAERRKCSQQLKIIRMLLLFVFSKVSVKWQQIIKF